MKIGDRVHVAPVAGLAQWVLGRVSDIRSKTITVDTDHFGTVHVPHHRVRPYEDGRDMTDG